MCKLTASIVVYKSSPNLLNEAIQSFLKAAPEAILYIIDNSPTDEARSVAQDARIKYFFNGSNIGFGAAHNIALNEILSSSSYHLVLNPDVNFEADVIARLTRFMDDNKNVGLVMPKVLYPDGRLQYLCRLLPSPATLFLRRFASPLARVKNKINHHYELQFSGYDRIMDVPFLSGCFMFLRVEALREVGLFDETIFLYTEDIDLTRRIHQRYRTVFYPEVVIYHHHVRESYKNWRTLVHHASSAVTYFNKWGWFLDYEREAINRRVLLKLSR
jgi:GT2 family glycosyltransferase